jgi:hypothetical protein
VALGLVKGQPVLDSVTESLEAEISVVIELINNVSTQERSLVSSVMHSIRDIPMEEGDPGSNISCNELVKDTIIKVDSFLIDLIKRDVREDS